jgi:hypothetical protein
MQRFDSYSSVSSLRSLSLNPFKIINSFGDNSNIITIRSSGFEKSPVQNRFKNYFALTFALSFEMREADRFFSWGPCGFFTGRFRSEGTITFASVTT